MIQSKYGGSMGSPLLAQQAWRLLAHPDSLCAQVLKAKYYLNVCLSDTTLSGNAPPGWRGIEHGA